MPAKKAPSKKAKPQKERFIEFAKSVGADDPKAMERTFKRVVPSRGPALAPPSSSRAKIAKKRGSPK